MKTIILKQIQISNFKGCRELSVDFMDKTTICGQNASGKSTISDAVQWLLFNKDSQGVEKFQVRPLDPEGSLVNNIEIKVSGILTVDGKEMEMQKVQKQKWVKKRGSEAPELQGNVNEYEVNGIPKSEAEYKRIISDIVEEQLFKLLTNSSAFTSMKWQEQRDILLKLVSEVTDSDVIESSSGEYIELAEPLSRFTVEELTAKSKKALKELKLRQAELPARIDEAHKAIVDIDVAELELFRNVLIEQITETEKMMEDNEKAYADFQTKSDQVFSLKTELNRMEQDAISVLLQERMDLQNKIREAQNRYSFIDASVLRTRTSIKNHEDTITKLEERKSKLGDQYRKIIAETLDEHTLYCPSCHQLLQEDKRSEVMDNFEESKKNRAGETIREGNALKSEIQELGKKLDECRTELDKKAVEGQHATDDIARFETALHEKPVSVDISRNAEYIMKKQELEEIEASVINVSNGSEYRSQLKTKISGLRKELSSTEKKIASADNTKTEMRISALEQEQKEVGQKAADQEKMIYLLEKFTRDKINLLGSKINEKFKLVNFKLFNMNINGGMTECCECTVDGVPYSVLNSGHKVLAGLDIIVSLSELYKVKAPIFIDNAEGINDYNLPDMDCQMVLLKVSDDRELRIA